MTRALSRIALGMQECLYIGNLSSRRDWGHARDYVRAMYLINQQDEPDDYVIATGVTTSIRDFIRLSAGEIGLEISFRGEGSEETGTLTAVDEKVYAEKTNVDAGAIRQRIGSEVVKVNPRYFRPTEVDMLIGDATKARERLGWEPEYDLAGLVREMMASDVKLMRRDDHLRSGGFRVMNYFE